MAKRTEIEFEDMDSTGMFGHLMDDSADKMKWNREKANELLEMANALEERAEKYRHLAAILVLDAQAFAEETANLLAMEYPMGDVEPQQEDPDDE